MKMNNLISEINREIAGYTKTIDSLNAKKQRFSKILAAYPDAEFERNSIYLQNVWSKISRMHFTYTSTYRSSIISIKCMTPERERIEGMQICQKIADSKISTISYNFQSQPRIHSILIHDYKSIIPAECPKRKIFLKRLRQHILDRISWQKLVLDPNSFYKDEIENFLMIK